MNVGSEATLKFGFIFGERERTPFGPATVAGVALNKLWFIVDGETKASYWSSCKTKEDFNRRGFVKLDGADRGVAMPSGPAAPQPSPARGASLLPQAT
ncbi:MAG: hypothetical protein Q8J97_07605, partial [Flavobacteriaceae bacterium]|nr:hypothetical protein [Flavobacteriaceae bacterium]